MIIDSIPVVGSLAIYGDYTTASPKALDITNAAVTVTQGPASATAGSTVYAYNQFDVTLTLKANSFISAADHIIVFKYPTDAVSPAGTVVTADAAPSDTLQVALKGNLGVKTFGTDGIYLDGVGEDLIPNRQFKLTLKGWKSLDTNIASNLSLFAIVYYKNTYSVLSYVENKIFTISKSDMSLTANHPEFWDVYESGAWPIAFTFRTTNDLTSGGWVVIQQTNTLDQIATAGNKISFIASTCDFSGNDSTFDNSFGKRPNCYPLRNDQNYDKTLTPYLGSGIFFYMKGTITANKDYKVTVWAFFDVCGGTDADSFNVVNKPASASTIPKFQLTVYKYMNPAKLNEDRFVTMPTGIVKNQVVASSNAIDFTGKCWNNKMYDTTASVGTDLDAATIPTLVDSGADTTKTSWLHYKELSEWYIFPQTSDSAATLTFFNNLNTSASAAIGSSKYFFSTSNTLGSGSYFLAYFRLPAQAGTPELWQTFPTPIIAAKKVPSGKVVYQFPSAWFTTGQGYKGTSPTPTCFASWNLSINNADNSKVTFNDVKVIPGFTNSQLVYGANVGLNFFGAATDKGSMIDTANSLLPPDNTLTGASNILRLVSVYQGGSTDATNTDRKFFFMAGIAPETALIATQFVQGAFFSSCVKWNSAAPSITSLYTYIDIQIKFNYIATDSGSKAGMGTTISNIRLIKLYPESGVFNDFDKNPTTGFPQANPFVNHVVYLASTSDSICLVELNGATLAGQKDSSANTLIVWLFGGTLLETDYSDQLATYPAAPLVSGITLYGLSSAQPMDTKNGYQVIGDNFTPLIQAFQNINTSGSLTGTGANDIPYSFKNNATNYIFFMGSVLLFTSVTSSNLTASTETALYVPYYCPKHVAMFGGLDADGTTALAVGLKRASIYPTIIAAWMNMSGYNSVGTLYKYVTYEDPNSGAASKPRYTLLANKFDKTANSYLDIFKTAAVAKTAGTLQTATLKWSPYTSTDQLLYVYNGTFSAANAADSICTGHSLFLHSSITIDTTVATAYAAGYTGSVGVYNGSKIYYAYGKPFTKAIFYGMNGAAAFSTANMARLISTGDSNSANYYTGIKRPTVDTLVSGGKLVLTDRVGFACASVNNGVNAGLTNYVVNSTGTNRIANFILDWNRKLTGTGSDWLTPSIAFDKTDVYKSDVAGNIKIVLSPPQPVPAGTQLKISAANNAFTGNTICGMIIVAGGIVNQCDTTSGTVTCTAPNGGTSFTVCCYNIAVSDPLALATVVASFPADTGVSGINTYITGDMYSASTQIASANNPFSFVTANASATDVIGTKAASISSIVYSQVNQEGGIGKVTFTVNLPREPTRDMKLSLIGDLSGMYIAGNIPRCHASFGKDSLFGANWDNGDALIDTCSSNNIQGGTPIVITTKKLVYKCGVSFSKSLYISLWPIIVVNWAGASVNKSFKVTMQLNASDNIALNTSPFDMTLASPVAAKAAFTGQWDNLCAVSSVTPRIPGELADYQFDIDLDTNKASLTNTNPNEVTIFFPYQYYGSFIPNVMCYYNTMLNCSFTDEGILNIRFNTNLTVGSGKKISITVVGIINPALDADYSFPCTINNTNFSTGARTNLITGSGKLTGGINTTAVTSMGSLRFLSITTPITDKNPRNVSVHRFRVAFDNAVTLTPSPVTIANTPVIHVYFPTNYKLAWYNNKPSATIDEYTNDANNLITKTSTIAPQSITLSGNRVTLELTQASYTFGTNWRYWDIIITNIVNPTDTTNQQGPPATQTTRPFFVTLTNKNLSSLYRTYSNVNTYASDALSTAVDAWLGWNRGNSFNFDNTKWVVDVYGNASQLNVLTVKAGRYLQAYFSIKANTNIALNPWVSTMSLTDQVFKTSVTSYSLSTSQIQPLGFLIGCPCGTAPGYYLVNFSSSDTTNFSALSPVVITVDTSSKGLISFQTPPTIPAGGSVFIGIILSEANFDQLSVNWVAGDNAKNDDSAKMTNATVPAGTVTPASTSSSSGQLSPVYSVFSITSTSTTLPAQAFKTADPNACFSFNGVNTLTLNIQGQTAIIPSSLNLATYFKYSNSETDTTITAKNSIKFQFTAPAAPIYLYCALACINMAYPADADILAPKVANSNLLQFYGNIISSIAPVDIIFSNLVRGQQYHMRCIIQSTQGDASQRTSSSVNLENYVQSGASNSTTVNIAPQAAQATQCAQFQFLSEPGQSTRNSIINHCQRVFSAPGWSSNGCIICTNSDMNYLAPGLSFPQNITCVATAAKTKLRFLQTSPIIPPNVTADVATSLTVCPIAHPICTTDASGNKAYNDYFTQFTGDLKTAALFKQNLNIDNVRLNTTNPIVTVTDAVAPDVTKVTAAITSSNANGAVSFTLSYTSPIQCFWQISDATTAPAYSALSTCADASWCGKNRVGQTSTTVSTTNLKAFTAGSTYNVYIGCTNDIPMAQKTSAVKSIGTFSIPKPVDPTPSPSVANSTTISANFINVSMFVLLLIFSLIFN